MCDYCDCRRIPEIADLGAENQRIEELAAPHLDSAGLEDLFDDLHRHIAIEEYDLFPAASQVLKDARWEAMV